MGDLTLTKRCRLTDYTRAMMIKPVLTIFATVALSAATSSFAQAQGYPAPSGYSVAPAPYSSSAMPDFDALDDEDDAPRGRSMALPTPGPVMSPDDPRYGRPAGAPVYSDRAAPQGPVMSPDDPRYGRPMGPPPVIYSDRPAGGQQTYSDRGYDDGRGMRPAGAARAPR